MSESFIKTEKIAIDHLLVEITRKCQLRCAHCLRGDAQNINMSPKIIDKLLESVCVIGSLLFTGGEPTMNLEGMRYFLEKMKANNIALHKLRLITNGCDISEETSTLIKEYYDYITYNQEYGNHKIIISISSDIYHRQSGGNPEKAYDIYKSVFSEYPLVEIALYDISSIPLAIGRAESLEEANENIEAYMPFKKIEVMSKNSHHYCVVRKYYRLEDGIDELIMCPTYVSVYGRVFHAEDSQMEFEQEDNTGVSLECENLIDAIKEHNRDAEYCVACMLAKQLVKDTLLDGDIIVKWFKFINRKLNGYSERVRAVDVDNFNNLAEDGTKYSISDDEAIAVVKEWYDDVGEDGVLRVKKIINEVFEKHLLGEEGIYQRQKAEVAEMLVNLAKTANTIEAPQARGFIKIIAQLANIVECGENEEHFKKEKRYFDKHGEIFLKEDEEMVRGQHPQWSHKDCVRYANSEKWIKYYSGRASNEDKIQLIRHQMILEDIRKKYKASDTINAMLNIQEK